MNTDLNRLSDIQENLDSAFILKKELKTLVDEVTELEEQKKQAEGALNAVVEQEKEHEGKIRQSEKDIEDIKNKILKSKGKLPDVKTNKEYKAILSEVEQFEKTINDIEEDILVHMEDMEGIKKETEAARAVYKEREKEFNEQKDGYKTQINQKEREIATLQATVNELKQDLTPSISVKFERLMTRNGDKPLARVVDGICQGCFQTIPPQDFIELKLATEPSTCNNCQRFIYFLKEE